MSNGICLVAQNNSKTDYIRQAYALALSILAKSPNTNISLITDDDVPYNVFDKVIPIPWSDMAHNDWKIENRWKVYHVTPYRNTIVFDVDMLVLENIDYIWKHYHNLVFTNSVKTYRNEIITDRYYRKTFDANELPDVYVGMYQFLKCESTHEFFTLLDIIMKNWKVFYRKYAPNNFQNWCSVDVSSAIALKILGQENNTLHQDSLLSFTHMKPQVQNLNSAPSKWTDLLPVDLENSDILINGYKQSGVLHYVEDNFLTDDVVQWLEEKV